MMKFVLPFLRILLSFFNEIIPGTTNYKPVSGLFSFIYLSSAAL